ncbi:MAG: uracil-DNA glycosylase [bacterium]|nr:uracil-DNA glycosylase [bacterium]
MGKKEAFEKLTGGIISCQRCPLYKTAIKAVPGEGNPEAEVFFIGEAPGFWEDQKGKPFVGEAGQLLDKLLTLIGLKREEVFIGNAINHRPPQNRDPKPVEIEACRFWLWEQLKIIDPKLIVTLGRFALWEFFPDSQISKVHGQKITCELNGQKKTVIPCFHPAAVLYRRQTLASLEEDFLQIKLFLRKMD